MDNFSGHNIDYVPKHIMLIHFEPGLTSHIQPLDAGIIRAFKAHYRRAFCLRAIEKDNAAEENIYKINLLEAMVMAEEAWESVSPATLKNCWNHTSIQRPPLPKIRLRHHLPLMPASLAAGWGIVVQYATEQWSLPEVHRRLQEHLGDLYVASEWNESLDSVLGAEDNSDAALAALDALRNKWAPDTRPELCEVATISNEHKRVEEELLDLVAQLKARRCIIGEPCTLEELLDPEEEQKIGEDPYVFEGGDAEIVKMVQREMGLAQGESEESEESGSDDQDPEVTPPSLKEMMNMCQIIEEYSMVVCTDGALEVVQSLRRYRGHLQRMATKGAQQTTLNTFFNLKVI